MPWIKMPGLDGRVYVPPEAVDASHKNDCPDCFHCQLCSADRCRLCRRPSGECRHGCVPKSSGHSHKSDDY
jgi:hypothetical protein